MKALLGDLVNIKTGKLDANQSDENGKYPFFTCSKEISKINSYSYDCECVLIAGNGDLNVKYYNGKFEAYQRTYILTSTDVNTLLNKYLYWFMNRYIVQLRNQSIGGVIKYIKLGDLTNISLNLPTLDVQKRIVGIFESIERLIGTKVFILKGLDDLIKSRFVELIAKNKLIYQKVRLKDCCLISSGATPSRKNSDYWDENGINWFKTTELKNNFLFDSDEKISKLGYEKSSVKLLPKHTVLIAMYGQGKTRGMTGYLLNNATTNQACVALISLDIINPKYLWYTMINSYDRLRNMAKGGSQPNLSVSLIKDFEIILPPIDIQNKFTNSIEQINKLKFA